ncbi:hypothetical protein C3L33_20884, partial [Rhododendron williamsianum]
MKAFGCFLLFSLLLSSFSSLSSTAQEIDVQLKFENLRLKRAYKALQAWKNSIFSDPFNMTESWVGPDVCSYYGVFCSPALDDPSLTVVAGIDINHGDIAGHLPPELELLTDIALYNDFEGPLPPELFELELDALFLNNNRFTSTIPETLGKSTVSVAVFANNKFSGCIPKSIGNMANLNEITFSNNSMVGCVPSEIGLLANASVIDLSSNKFTGELPTALGA